MRLRAVLLVLAASFVVCGDDTQPLLLALDDLGKAADHLRDDVAAHGRRVDGLSAFDAAGQVERQFSAQMLERVGALRSALDRMSLCTRPDGEAPDLGALWTVVAGFDGDLGLHELGMTGAGVMGAARVEERRYQAAADQRFADLRAAIESLDEGGAAYACPLD